MAPLAAKPCTNICLPTYGSVDPETLFSFTKLVLRSAPLLLDLKTRCLLYIDQARNLLSKDSLATEATHTLWLDADMVWPDDLLERLLSHDKPVVGANYFRKVYPFDTTGGDFVVNTDKGNRSYGDVKVQPLKRLRPGLHKIDCLGMGATLVRNDVLRQMQEKYDDELWFSSEQGGEDLWFFYRLKQMNIPVYLDFDVVCGHMARQCIMDGYWRSARGIPEPGAVEVTTIDRVSNPQLSDFGELYSRMIKEMPDGGVAVEVGCFLGASLVNLVQFAAKSGKKIYVYGVDHFKGSADDVHQDLARRHGGDFYKVFEENLTNHGVKIKEHELMTGKPWLDAVNVIRENSVVAAVGFGDGEIDFCFIDAEHGYESVVADIKAWLPKVKPGGILAGHDYHWQSVKRAATELLPDHVGDGNCWVWRKPK